ncbi:hypothetical protein BDF19DRAFT_6 [Syncephalis fuscata]|nr:hypothetical protein BDF19DRAFT_6 [Syncephalis fuscata]
MLDMSEFPALGATPPPPSSTSSTVNHSHNDSVTAMSPSSTPNDQSHSIPAAAVVATTPTNTMMMMDGVGLSTSTTTSIVSPTPTSSLLMLGNPMVQQQQQHSHTISTSVSSTSTMATNHHAHTSIGSLPNAASLLSSSVGSLPINGAAHALHFGHSPVVPGASPASLSMANQQRKVGEFTLDDFPALGGSTTPSSDSQTLKPTGDRLPGSAPTSLHETSAAVVARRLNGVNDISDNSNNSTNTTDMSNDMTIRPISGSNSVIANGVWGSSDHHATLASRIMAAQANSQANNTAVSSNSNINSVTSTTTTTTTTTAPSSISHEKISTGLDVFNHSAVSPHTHPTPPLDTKNTMVTGTPRNRRSIIAFSRY